jgi:hypothetical protein
MPEMTPPYNIDPDDPKFHSQTRDGEPDKPWKKLIAHNYLWTNLAVWAVAIWMIVKKLRGNFYPVTFFYYFLLSMPIAFMWGYYMHYLDPAYKAWNALPFQTVGKVGPWSIEDILFYTGCAFLYYCVFRLAQMRFGRWSDFRFGNHLKALFWCLVASGVAFFGFFGEACGRSLSVMYMAPGMIMMVYVWKEVNSKVFLAFFAVMLAFEIIWDYAMVSWIHYIPGWSWASGWFYISFGPDGTPYHSHVFMKYPFGWLWENPVEITPWYGVAGGLYPYMLILTIDKFRKKGGW